MRVMWILFLVVVVLMSLAAGGAKVFQVPQEVAFFERAGLASVWLYPLGAIQITGGVLSVIMKSRIIGIFLMSLGFLASAIVIFIVGQIGFAIISLLPAAVCALLILRFKRTN